MVSGNFDRLAYWHSATRSRDALTSALTSVISSRSFCRCPPFQALRETRSLPSGVLGPVDLAQGRHCFTSSACLRLRSNVQPLTMICLQ